MSKKRRSRVGVVYVVRGIRLLEFLVGTGDREWQAFADTFIGWCNRSESQRPLRCFPCGGEITGWPLAFVLVLPCDETIRHGLGGPICHACVDDSDTAIAQRTAAALDCPHIDIAPTVGTA